jgi:acyl carrier protein
MRKYVQTANRLSRACHLGDFLDHIGLIVELSTQVKALLEGALNLQGRAEKMSAETPLLGAVPELDSMGVVALITAMEEQFGFSVSDDEIDGAVFQTFGSLQSFIADKLAV